LTFGERLRRAREIRGMKQVEVALAAQMSNTYLSDLEKQRNNKGTPTGEVLARLANALHTSTDYLLGRSEDIDATNTAPPQTLEEELAGIEQKFRATRRFKEDQIDALMRIARSIAESAKSDESPDI
jgi:transcriptional regulator with XRE-family HTH domain